MITPQQAFEAVKILVPKTVKITPGCVKNGLAIISRKDDSWSQTQFLLGVEIDWNGTTEYPLPERVFRCNALKPGWIAKDHDGEWFWFQNRPFSGETVWKTDTAFGFDIGFLALEFPVVDWRNSLHRVVDE